MSKDTCKLYPEVTTPKGGVEASRLYKDLLNKDKFDYPRPFVNMVYANYIVSNIEAKMEAEKNADGTPKYQRNRQGQFSAKDVVEYLDLNKVFGEINTMSDEERRIGSVDSNGNKVDYTNAEEALKKIVDFNNTHKGLVAYLIPHGEVYNINVYTKDSRTITMSTTMQNMLDTWNRRKQVFEEAGVDITKMPEELNSIFNASNTFLDQYLKNLTSQKNGDFYKKDAMALLYIDKDSDEVQRLVKKFGSIEEAALALDDFNHGNITLPSNEQHLLQMALNHAKKLHGIDIDALVDEMNKMTKSSLKSPEWKIKHEIIRENKKWGIDKLEINRINNEIKFLSQANAEAAVQIDRRIKELYKEKGTNEEGRQLESVLNKLMNELNTNHYYTGIIDFLNIAGEDASKLDKLLESVPQDGDERTRIFNTIKTLQDAKKVINQYKYIVKALASDGITVDEAVTMENIKNIKDKAEKLSKFFAKKEGVIKDQTKTILHDFFVMATDGKMSEGEIHSILEKEVMEAGWTDRWLNSVGTAKNTFIAAAGTIMRNQEIQRDQANTAIKHQINRANYKLTKAGYNTRFMYEDEQHIVSNINWKAYDAAKEKQQKKLTRQGYRGFDFKQQMEDWEAANTEERLVDKKNGRKERVPNKNYRKIEDFQKGWSKEQKEYYDTMMELKGELETLYPEKGRNYYLPPQVRRNMVDAITDSTKEGNVKGIGKALKDKLKNFYTIREDDTDYAENGMVNGEEVTFGDGNYDNTEKKEIPIFFQKPVEKGELLLDFSSGMSRLAGSAINYDAMNSIRDVMEFMRDYADEKKAPANKTQVVDNGMIRVTKDLYKIAKKNGVAEILNGFIDSHIYGIKQFDEKMPKGLVKALDSIRNYTSLKGLMFNAPGAMANALTGVQQIFIDAGSGEFFGGKDLIWATGKLFGDAGLKGEAMEILSNNASHKAKLLRDLFDPMQENFENDKNKRYHSSMFRQLISKDCSFIGYGAGEWAIHMLPMYAILHKQKVKLNGEKISLYDALEVTNKQDGNAELKIKDGVTDLDGNPITDTYINKVRGIISYANKTMHGAMNAEDRGLIHQYVLGRLAMNFRQWMVGFYSRRFSRRHFNFDLKDYREGYWTTLYKALVTDDVKDEWKASTWKNGRLNVMGQFLKDFTTFMCRSSTQWSNLNDMQKANIKRVRSEMLTYIALIGLSFALGEPDDHKKEFWRRWWIYQTKRMITDTEAGLPMPQLFNSGMTILNSPMAGIPTITALMYTVAGLYNGDVFTEIQSGKHKGENRYIRNMIKYNLPLFKDIEKMENFDSDDSLFKVFDYNLGNH